jgi:hypothetical protein
MNRFNYSTRFFEVYDELMTINSVQGGGELWNG